MLIDSGKLSAIIDFSGAAVGDPACDLVIAWTYLSGKAHKIFMSEWLDRDTWLRARAWALWTDYNDKIMQEVYFIPWNFSSRFTHCSNVKRSVFLGVLNKNDLDSILKKHLS